MMPREKKNRNIFMHNLKNIFDLLLQAFARTVFCCDYDCKKMNLCLSSSVSFFFSSFSSVLLIFMYASVVCSCFIGEVFHQLCSSQFPPYKVSPLDEVILPPPNLFLFSEC